MGRVLYYYVWSACFENESVHYRQATDEPIEKWILKKSESHDGGF